MGADVEGFLSRVLVAIIDVRGRILGVRKGERGKRMKVRGS